MKIIAKIILSIIFIIFIFNICVYPVNNISDCSKMSQIMSTANFLHDDSNYKEQWALNNINKDEISFGINMPKKEEIDITKKEEVIVGIIDSGIDINHINLREHIYVNSNEIPDNGIDDDKNGYIDVINGWDFVNNDNTVFDYFSIDKHGTQCAGIIKLVSEEFNVKIMPLKVMTVLQDFLVLPFLKLPVRKLNRYPVL
jgi:subtilisin family serine protease